MKKLAATLLLSLSAALASCDASAEYDAPLTGADSGEVKDYISAGLAAYVGSVQPHYTSQLMLFGGTLGMVYTDHTLGWRWDYPAALLLTGVIDNYADHHGVSQGRIFAANSLILGFTVAHVYAHLHEDGPSPRQGLYLAPLPTERGALLGYRWTF